MEHQLEYDEDYNFGRQSVSCASSAGSFSTASSFSGPHTPTSGRSSPQQGVMSLDIESIQCSAGVGYELTPPASAFSGYFHSDVKSDMHPLMEYDMGAHSNRKSSVATTNMDFDFNDMFNAMPPHTSALESANHHVFGGPAYSDHLSSSPYMPTPSFPLSTTCDISSMWACAGDNSSSPFDRHDAACLSSPTRHIFAANGRRRLNLDEVQSRTSALHRVQRNNPRLHVRKEKRAQDEMWPTVIKYKSGAYKCNAPECAGQKTYKRQEHLKRHILSKHKPCPVTICEFCEKPFNRRDNYRQHLKLHTQEDRPSSRTKFFAAAVSKYRAEMQRTKPRAHPAKKKKDLLKEEEVDC